jgi:hypothetical protein
MAGSPFVMETSTRPLVSRLLETLAFARSSDCPMQARVARKAVVADDPFSPMITTELDEHRASQSACAGYCSWSGAVSASPMGRVIANRAQR